MRKKKSVQLSKTTVTPASSLTMGCSSTSLSITATPLGATPLKSSSSSKAADTRITSSRGILFAGVSCLPRLFAISFAFVIVFLAWFEGFGVVKANVSSLSRGEEGYRASSRKRRGRNDDADDDADAEKALVDVSPNDIRSGAEGDGSDDSVGAYSLTAAHGNTHNYRLGGGEKAALYHFYTSISPSAVFSTPTHMKGARHIDDDTKNTNAVVGISFLDQLNHAMFGRLHSRHHSLIDSPYDGGTMRRRRKRGAEGENGEGNNAGGHHHNDDDESLCTMPTIINKQTATPRLTCFVHENAKRRWLARCQIKKCRKRRRDGRVSHGGHLKTMGVAVVESTKISLSAPQRMPSSMAGFGCRFCGAWGLAVDPTSIWEVRGRLKHRLPLAMAVENSSGGGDGSLILILIIIIVFASIDPSPCRL